MISCASNSQFLFRVCLLLAVFSHVWQQELQAGKRYALVVGVKSYRPGQPLTELSYTERDVEGLAAVLKSGGYDVTLMTQTIGREAGKEVFAPLSDYIRDQLTSILDNPFLKDDDIVLLAFAGHGVQYELIDDEGRKTPKYYFCPADADVARLTTANEIADKHRLLDLGEIYDSLQKCKAGGKLLLVDACRNDPTKPGLARSLASSTLPPLPPPPGGTAAFFSCSAHQQAFEDKDLQHGVFFHHVIQALKGDADSSTPSRPADGKITLAELSEHVSASTYDFVRRKFQGAKQAPEMKGEFRLSIPLIEIAPQNSLLVTLSDPDYLRAIDLYGGNSEKNIQINLKEAYRLFRITAERGNPMAMSFVSEQYYTGVFITVDENEGLKWAQRALPGLKQLAEGGEPTAQNNLAVLYALGRAVPQDDAEAIRWLRKAADQNLSWAQSNLGFMTLYGRGVPADDTEAIRWFTLAANQNYASALGWLGEAHEEGQGVPQDYAQAKSYYLRAANLGHADSQNRLGVMYYDGNGVSVDYGEAVKWYRRAVTQDHAMARRNLAVAVMEGKGALKNPAEAVRLLEEAAAKGVAEAESYLGLIYLDGIGVKQDYQLAFQWYSRAAAKADPTAQNNLGWMYQEGRGVQQNDTEAVKWYRLAADQDYGMGYFNLGYMNLQGRGVRKNRQEAIRLFRLALESDDEDAAQAAREQLTALGIN